MKYKKSMGSKHSLTKEKKEYTKNSLAIIWIREYTTQAFEMEKPNRKRHAEENKIAY